MNAVIDIWRPDSIAEAIATINSVEDHFRRKCEEFLTKLGYIGLESMEAKFQAIPIASDERDIRLQIDTRDASKGSVTIEAGGTQVLFVEFGYGVQRVDSPQARAALVAGTDIAGHGQYGYHLGKMPKGWDYPGNNDTNVPIGTYQKSDGIMHTMGENAMTPVFRTREEIRRLIENTAVEVFSE